MKTKNKRKKRFVVLLIICFTATYFVFEIFYFNSTNIKTELVNNIKASEKIYTRGYMIKDETTVYYDNSKIISCELENGDSIAGNGVLAKLFESPKDAQLDRKIKNLKKKLECLNSINFNDKNHLDSFALNEQTKQEITNLNQEINVQNFNKVDLISNQLLYLFTQRRYLLNHNIDFQAKISEVESSISELENSYLSYVGEVRSPCAGFFVNKIDGYENYFDYKNIMNINLDSLFDNFPDVLDDQVVNNLSVAGKIIGSMKWYIACAIPANDALKLKLYDEVFVSFPLSVGNQIPAKIIRIEQKDIYSEAKLIMETDYMSPELAELRSEDIIIETEFHSGLQVSQKAIHIENVTRERIDENGQSIVESKEVEGVYTTYGRELQFKQIIPIHVYKDFVLCAPEPASEDLFTKGTIKAYDEVVVDGINLYDGKLIR